MGEVMGMPPTLLIDSGWGLHYHYAFEGQLTHGIKAHADARRKLVAEVNRRCEDRIPGMRWLNACDYTIDPGSRLARYPGTTNKRCPLIPRKVRVLESDETVVIDEELLQELAVEHTPVALKEAPKQQPLPAPSAAPRSGTQPAERIDFNSQVVRSADGDSTIADLARRLGPEGRMDVVCPFSGTSLGSAFIRKDSQGRVSMVSNAEGKTYMHDAQRAKPPKQVAPPRGSGAPSSLGANSAEAPDPKPVKARRYASIPERWQRQEQNRETKQFFYMGDRYPAADFDTDTCRLILEDDSTFDLWLNSWSGVYMDGDSPQSEFHHVGVCSVLQVDYSWKGRKTQEFIKGVVGYVSAQTERNPVQDYLRDCRAEWDGRHRINSWLDTVVYAPARKLQADHTYEHRESISIARVDPELLRAYSRRWMIGFVARAMQPGCQMDTQLILFGGQGFGKSRTCKALVPDQQYYIGGRINFSDPKQAGEVLADAWLVEDAELSSKGRTKDNEMKQFLSQGKANFRRAYARGAKGELAHYVVVGTANDHDMLTDPTGSRRYWVVPCPEMIGFTPDTLPPIRPRADVEWLAAHRDQLLGEAMAAYESGEQWYLTEDEDLLRGMLNSSYQSASTMQEVADLVYERNGGGVENAITVEDFWKFFDPDGSPQEMMRLGTKISDALITAGFRKHSQKIQKRTAYFKPVGNRGPNPNRKGTEQTKSTHEPKEA
jgi:predicted P-loop ATPase